MSSNWKLEQDLDSINSACVDIFSALAGARIFLTGGTGFIGCWLLEAVRHANVKLNTGITVRVLTRSDLLFKKKYPELANNGAFSFINGDVCDEILDFDSYTHVIHAATDASADLNETNPLKMFNTVVEGTRRALQFTNRQKSARLLFLSSGAVYGQQPWKIGKVPESWLGGPNCVEPRAAYAEGKRAAEMLCAVYHKQFGLDVVIARIFALLGPYLPLSTHFAAGNFIRDAIDGYTISVNGDGTPQRSYLYASDLIVWLLHILVKARPMQPINVGSEEAISVADLARKISTVIGLGKYEILGKAQIGWNPGIYVPDTCLAATQLGLTRTVTLDQAILRTALWHGWKMRNQQ
jgi:nucleoside-diphosphate-sugar epimerase